MEECTLESLKTAFCFSSVLTGTGCENCALRFYLWQKSDVQTARVLPHFHRASTEIAAFEWSGKRFTSDVISTGARPGSSPS